MTYRLQPNDLARQAGNDLEAGIFLDLFHTSEDEMVRAGFERSRICKVADACPQDCFGEESEVGRSNAGCGK